MTSLHKYNPTEPHLPGWKAPFSAAAVTIIILQNYQNFQRRSNFFSTYMHLLQHTVLLILEFSWIHLGMLFEIFILQHLISLPSNDDVSERCFTQNAIRSNVIRCNVELQGFGRSAWSDCYYTLVCNAIIPTLFRESWFACVLFKKLTTYYCRNKEGEKANGVCRHAQLTVRKVFYRKHETLFAKQIIIIDFTWILLFTKRKKKIHCYRPP